MIKGVFYVTTTACVYVLSCSATALSPIALLMLQVSTDEQIFLLLPPVPQPT